WGAELRREAVERLGCPTATAFRLASAAAEAVENAMLRGNLEISPALSDAGDAAMVAQLVETRRRQNPFRERCVWASCRFSAEDICVVVRDEGPGFTSAPDWPAGVPAPLLGRGGLILRALCDDVRYNADGNEVTLLIALSSQSAAPSERTAVDRVSLHT
ncbi:MAG TPA: ATP-binding protein, partial [Planctomycetaceae bacterium]|nr:ATP-binding protein [Planctomycetaceae bacterium]